MIVVACKNTALCEEITRYEWIDKEKLLESAARYGKSPYGKHLQAVAEGKVRG